MPYTELVEGINAKGILVNTLYTVCQTIDAECRFVGGELINYPGYANYRLHALLVVDAILLPNIDKLSLPPAMSYQTSFLQKQPYPTIEAFIHSAIIGVQQDSLLHLYLLDKYAGNARLRSYSLLENSLFDLAFGRIDALFVVNVFS